MTRIVPLRLKGVLAAAAVAAAFPLASCNAPAGAYDDEVPYALPDLPATLPLALGEPTPPVYAPAAAQIPYAQPIPAGYIADTDDHYAYAEDAWGFTDALGYAPPDYGFEYDDVEPWAWQGYDDSMMFVEPLDYGYRYYYYRPGDEYPYFVRDPDCGYGYDDGRLAVIYGSDGRVIHYSAYDTYLPHASAYYYRGHRLWGASRHRQPVIVGNWEHRRHGIYNSYRHWSQERARHRDWQNYHRRISDRQERYWEGERVRRMADRIRYATWREQDFRTPPPPRAIPSRWTRAEWARDERRYAPPVRGFDGDRRDQQRAARQERLRLAALNRQTVEPRRERSRDSVEQRRDRRTELAQLRSERRDLRQERLDRRAEARPAVLRAQQREARQDDSRRLQAQQRRAQQAERRELAQGQRRQALVERQRVRTERRPAQVRAAQTNDRVERQRAQAEQRRQQRSAGAEARQREQRQSEVRAEAQQRRQAQAAERRQAQERRQVRAREERQVETRRAQVQERRQTEARERQQTQSRAREEVQQRRQEQSQVRERAEQRRSERSQVREQAEARQQAQREQAEARSRQRSEAQQQRRQQAEAEPRQAARPERPARSAEADSDRSARAEARRARREAREQ